ncbi:hypothetical protein MTYP_01690 [Methylophilaceae bacterium]|nr:hypothetical protein MTYP_01690 [Methylophilaceae bacterium]
MRRFIHFPWLLVLLGLPAGAASKPVDARDMKAALIYNFAVFTSWPENGSNAFTVCAFDEDQDNVNRHLLKSKNINGRQVHFTIIRHIGELENCQVLYLEKSKNLENKRLSESLVDFSILSIVDVTEKPGDSGIISIRQVNSKYYFTINNEEAKRAGLMVSSKLLRLAAEVY